MLVSYYLRRKNLKGVDVVGLYQVLKAIGYEVLIGNGIIIIVSSIGPFESRQHVKEELRLDVEALLERFRIKK
jgi:hypothetical protein